MMVFREQIGLTERRFFHVGLYQAVSDETRISLSVCVCVCGCPPVLGKIRSAVGSAQLLMSQKFQQFYWLCQQNMVSLSKYIYSFVVYMCLSFILHLSNQLRQ